MTRKISMILATVAVVAVAGAVTDASAACGTAKSFFLVDLNAPPVDFKWVDFPADADNNITGGVLKGRHWQAGNRAAHNEGLACPENSYLLPNPDDLSGRQLGILGALSGDVIGGTCDPVGCVPDSMVMFLQTLSTDATKAYYAAGRINENAEGGFRYSDGGVNWPMTPFPRPRVTSSSRGGSTVTVNVSIDAPAGARGETGFQPNAIVTGYQIVRFEGPGDPGRNAASWQNLGPVLSVLPSGASAGGVGLVCGGTSDDVFVATRLILDGGQYSSDYVSASTRVECDPAVADPRFKMIDRSKSGRGTIRTNPR